MLSVGLLVCPFIGLPVYWFTGGRLSGGHTNKPINQYTRIKLRNQLVEMAAIGNVLSRTGCYVNK